MKRFKNLKRISNRLFGAQTREYFKNARNNAVYLTVMGGVLDNINDSNVNVIQQNITSISSYSAIAYSLAIGTIVLSVFIVRLWVKYHNKVHYNAGLNTGVEMGKQEGKQELLHEQEEEQLKKAEESEEETESKDEVKDEDKMDIDYDMVIEDIDKYTESLSDADKDQPVIQNINKFVTGYKFLKPPDVAVLSLTKRFDEYEVSIALPEKRKGASKISEFIPFDEKTRKEIQDEFDATAQLNNSMVGMPNMGGMGGLITSRLEGLGKRISGTFIPDNVLKNLKDIKDPIIIESNDGEILWETIHDGSNYIALEHPIGRVLKTKEEARINEFERGEKLRFLMICNPTGDLESTEREVNYIESILKQKVIIDKLVKEKATKDNIINALSSGQYDVIHYAGHADSESEGEAALLTSNGKLFSSEIKSALNGRPYVYLNACGSGRESIDESKDYTKVSDTEGLASAFILGGAIGFMGAFWPVPDKSAAEFSVKFYEGLIENLKVGESCRQARLELLKQNESDITWAAFLQYGDPVQRLREKKTEKDKELETKEEDELESDAEVEVVDEEEYEKTLEEKELGEGEGEETKKVGEEEEEEKLSEEERLKRYQGWIVGGLEHMKNKKYEDAITAFDSAIGLDANRYNAWHLTGNALRELRRYNEALECYDKALERDTTIDEVWYDKALALGSVGRFDEAMECKTTSESLKVGRVKEWLKKANELMAHGGIQDAIKIYQRILKENEKYPLAWYLMGLAFKELGEFEKALENYEQSTKYARNFSLGYHKKAEILFILGQNDAALQNIEKAIELNPINEEALMLKSDILIKLDNYKQALAALNQILFSNKNNGDALFRKAKILRLYNKKKESLQLYEQVINLDPTNQDGWYWRAVIMNELGSSEDEELKCYDRLLDMEPVNQEVLIGVGRLLDKKEGLNELKLKWYNKMLLSNPNDTFAWLNKGLALEGLSRTSEAIDAYNKVIELDSSNQTSLFKLAKFYEEHGEYKKALEHYKKLIKLIPKDHNIILGISINEYKLGNYNESLDGFKKLFKIKPSDINVLENMHNIYKELDQKKNDMVILNRLQKLEPENLKYKLEFLNLLHNFKNYPEIIKLTDSLIVEMPDNIDLLIKRAEALSNMNKVDQALECWNKIIELKSEKKEVD